MSMALLRTSLEIVEENITSTKNNKKKNNKNIDNGNASMKLGKKFKGSHIEKIERQPKFNIQKVREEMESRSGRAEENAMKLLRLSQTKLQPEVAQKILQRGRTGRYIVEVEKPREELESLYTEDDFLTFEKEYFGS